eukprot:CAMPEP_0172569870 /NCGR_PEP_ID=MMETSP1067-20121228/125288_1 /TAXON_ID=265564 ORGANISM="Thalassiosira punctigera, Strain Tpunct2005C2" /NCGR_SAMPLE_ID=MMETSP1067 /ASSEMBLY_ACC=CAM_ASM_000444 /LENGTH=65 /DNA_ID=CAMNT_0013361805 /DNA_START=12 /DNA_END=206 /DNA_ORIENTATION=-
MALELGVKLALGQELGIERLVGAKVTKRVELKSFEADVPLTTVVSFAVAEEVGTQLELGTELKLG